MIVRQKRREAYLMAFNVAMAFKVAAIESLAMKAALHQPEPLPVGLIGETFAAENVAVPSLVNMLHWALVRLVP